MTIPVGMRTCPFCLVISYLIGGVSGNGGCLQPLDPEFLYTRSVERHYLYRATSFAGISVKHVQDCKIIVEGFPDFRLILILVLTTRSLRLRPRLHVPSMTMSPFSYRLKWVQCSPMMLFSCLHITSNTSQGEAQNNGDVDGSCEQAGSFTPSDSVTVIVTNQWRIHDFPEANSPGREGGNIRFCQ